MLQGFRQRLGVKLAAFVAIATLIGNTAANAQTVIRNGVLPFARLTAWSQQSNLNLSSGYLADLQADPNFVGDYQSIFNAASKILTGYTVVARAGYFPENRGIARDKQLPVSDAVYYIFEMAGGNKLVLYRSPTEDTSRYFIRRDGAGFLLPN